MKKLIFALLLMAICRLLPAPGLAVLYIPIAKPLTITWDNICAAVSWVEVGEGNDLYNELENAVGWFQIRQCRVTEYNKLRGTHYKLRDFYDYELSKQMFMFYAQGKSFEQAVKDWNGSGKQTIEYWNKVKAAI